mmetsp:Transcript_10221/g.15551  ORF Transcript_10221/g.15551 Transcript_10221/m.15551 type:complete len:307 (-) Transcript_10221:40-960(-)
MLSKRSSTSATKRPFRCSLKSSTRRSLSRSSSRITLVITFSCASSTTASAKKPSRACALRSRRDSSSSSELTKLTIRVLKLTLHSSSSKSGTNSLTRLRPSSVARGNSPLTLPRPSTVASSRISKTIGRGQILGSTSSKTTLNSSSRNSITRSNSRTTNSPTIANSRITKWGTRPTDSNRSNRSMETTQGLWGTPQAARLTPVMSSEKPSPISNPSSISRSRLGHLARRSMASNPSIHSTSSSNPPDSTKTSMPSNTSSAHRTQAERAEGGAAVVDVGIGAESTDSINSRIPIEDNRHYHQRPIIF